MTMIPDTYVEELRRRVDIVEVVSEYVQLRRAGRSYVGLCPFHNERTPSFSVSPERQMYHCFGCGAGGTVIRFIMDSEGLSFVEAVTKLSARTDLQMPFLPEPQSQPSEDQIRFTRMKEAHELATKYYNYILMNTAAGVQALAYLEKRGISRQIIVEFRLGYAPDRENTLVSFLKRRGFDEKLLVDAGLGVMLGSKLADRFRNRVIIPIADAQGNVVSFGGRTMDPEGKPKYLNSPETPIFQKSHLLFNLNLARKDIRKTRSVVLFEGYMDVISAWQAGVRNGVASMGTSLTADHARILHRYAERLTIAYDGDAAGIKATKRAMELAGELKFTIRVVEFPDGKDPDDYVRAYGSAAFQRQVSDLALTDLQFLLKDLRTRANLESPAGRTEFMREALSLLGVKGTPIEQETELRNLSQEFQVSMETLKEELALVTKQQSRRRTRANHRDWTAPTQPAVLPKGHVLAANRLLQAMMTDSATFQYLYDAGLDELALPEQTALLAHFYSFRSEHPDGTVTAFVDSLDDPGLIGLASSLLMDEPPELDAEVITDYLRTIRLHTLEVEYQATLRQMVELQVQGRLDELEILKSNLEELQDKITEMKAPRGK